MHRSDQVICHNLVAVRGGSLAILVWRSGEGSSPQPTPHTRNLIQGRPVWCSANKHQLAALLRSSVMEALFWSELDFVIAADRVVLDTDVDGDHRNCEPKMAGVPQFLSLPH
ncbi:hypothetical protein PVAP13_8KG390815 [Panicum virgatum]|uniref:Uncharacterized protein n=1 Tax=Panicum virgatum TaxID=38727 RepID=A0A8T0PV50_PANVG|nr:hypothetical protein PVAP13_8KG390815 [Panicum virgatum]